MLGLRRREQKNGAIGVENLVQSRRGRSAIASSTVKTWLVEAIGIPQLWSFWASDRSSDEGKRNAARKAPD